SMEAAASSIWLLFFLLEYETQFTLTALDWLNFNSDNYPARGGFVQVFSANPHCLPRRVLSDCLNGTLGLREVSKFGAKSLWQFCFRFEFSENEFSKFTGFKAHERQQSLSYFGF
ncbi:hypothetical protein, partial [Vibrio navarrensis]|uniref:hypothetical protein n=1 Tax=Vibrio navarrensis TaxID=29495 RepID=UPI0029BFBA5A